MIPVLDIRRLSKAFPGVKALNEVDLQVHGGEIHALVGENGAGKSTLVKILAGLYRPDAGEIRLLGEPLRHLDPHRAGELGIGVVHQHIGLFLSLTGLENLFAGDLPTTVIGRVDWTRMRREATELLAELGVTPDLDRPVGELTVAERQQIQIARALRRKSCLLILDEPTAALGEREVEALFSLLRHLRDQGLAIVYISHRLEEVLAIADRITVLRDGQTVGVADTEDVDRKTIVAMMVGREVAEERRLEPVKGGEVLLGVRHLSVDGRLHEVSLEVRAGEVLGVAGLAGSGKEELVRALFGLLPRRSGEIFTPAGPANLAGPATARQLGIAYVPGDRHGQSVLVDMNVRENITLSVLRQLSTLGFPAQRLEANLAERFRTELDVRATSLEQPLATLSGGNQQKVAVARRLAEQPRVLILEEPTQGVDVAARAAIHDIVRNLAAEGVGILLVSSDLPELLSLSHRVAVLREGQIVATFAAEEATPERVMEAALATQATQADREVAHPQRRVRLPMREAALAMVLGVLSGVLAVHDPDFAQAHNLLGILINTSHLAICAAGMTAVIIAGGIDVSIGAMLATTCMVMGMLLERTSSTPLACLLSILLGTALGALNGVLATWLGVPAIVATLGTRSIWRGVAMRLNGGNWITHVPPSFERLGDRTLLGIPCPVTVAGICAVVMAVILGHTRPGRSMHAVGDDSAAARAAGIRPLRTQFAAFMTLGFWVGIASIVYATTNPPIQPTAAPTLELVTITAVMVGGTNILGGSGSILGTMLGVLVLGVISNGLTLMKIDDFWAQALQGALILAAVMTDILRRRL
ncbi:MAG: ATP-binding cassette domain-containing protein, partial [Candidatus Zipacnadales bacterium]